MADADDFAAGLYEVIVDASGLVAEEQEGMWKGRARSLLWPLTRALAHLDRTGQLSSLANGLWMHLQLPAFYDLAFGDAYALPDDVRDHLQRALALLPGFRPDRGRNQNKTTSDQFAFLIMPLLKKGTVEAVSQWREARRTTAASNVGASDDGLAPGSSAF